MNKRLHRHLERKKTLLKSAADLLDIADVAGRELTESEQTIADGYQAEVKELNEKIADEQSKAVHLNESPMAGFEIDPPGTISNGSGGSIRVKGRVGASFTDLFASSGGTNMESPEFFSALHAGAYHPGLQMLKEGTGSAGGYLVPEEVVRDYMGVAYENSIVWKRATVFPMKAETLKVPGFDASTAADKTLFGGMSWSWLQEEGEGTVANPTLTKIELHAKKLAIFATSSNELIEDGLSLQTQLETAMQKGTGWSLDHSFINGNGAGEPLGFLNDPAKIEVAKESGQAADTVVYENAVNMMARLHPSCWKNAVWLANPSIIPQLLTMTVDLGTGGAVIPVITLGDDEFNLLTRPLIFTEKLPTLGDVGDLVLADLSQYAIGMRRELTIQKSMHVNFMTDQTTWRGIVRCDGQGLWTGPYTPANGDTQSWCVTLAERA